MMGLYRRLPYLISKIIRTFKSNARISGVSKEAVQVRYISDPYQVKPTAIIRFGVGYADDNYIGGISHLYEHLNVNTVVSGTIGETLREHTIYLMSRDDKATFWTDLNEMLTVLFSTDVTSNNATFIENQRNSVIGEFYDRIHPDFNERMLQIYKFSGMSMDNFGCGNDDTFRVSGADLLVGLEAIRDLYRTCSVFVCICSSLSLNEMEENFKPYFDIFGKGRERKDPINITRPTEPFQRFLVVRPDCNTLQLRIMFPFDKTITLKERNTITYFFDSLSYTEPYNFDDFLIDNKIGRRNMVGYYWSGNCVIIDLFNDRKETVDKAAKSLTVYLKKMNSIWNSNQFDNVIQSSADRSRTVFYKLSCVDQFKLIAKHCNDLPPIDTAGSTVSEHLHFLHAAIMAEKSADLIKTQILENKFIHYSIVTEKPEDSIMKYTTTNPTKQLEKYFGTEFYQIDDATLPTEENVTLLNEENIIFTSKDRRRIVTPIVYINDTTNKAYLSLCIANVIFHVKLLRSLDVSFPSELRYHSEISSATAHKFKDFKAFTDPVKGIDPFRMNGEQLQLAVGYVKRSLSSDLTDSMALAESLLNAAVQRSYGNVQIYPVPNQYNSLSNINIPTWENYANQKINPNLSTPTISKKKNRNFSIKSINANQRRTVTLHFLKFETINVDRYYYNLAYMEAADTEIRKIRRELGIYTAKADVVDIGGIEGLLYEVNTKEIGNANVIDEIHSYVTQPDQSIKKIIDYANNIYKTYFNAEETLKIEDRLITVQIRGYQKITDHNPMTHASFDDKFEDWYSHHKDDFDFFKN